MLWEEMAKYTELTGEDATHVPLIKLGAYLDGYEKGIEVLDKIRAEIWDLQYGDEEKSMTDEDRADAYNNAIRQVIEIINKHKAESEEE